VTTLDTSCGYEVPGIVLLQAHPCTCGIKIIPRTSQPCLVSGALTLLPSVLSKEKCHVLPSEP